MSHIIFRKSVNTNSFGLRGYWTRNANTRQLHSFATSQDLAIGATVNPHDYELPRLEATLSPSQFKGLTK
jgi:hypothetical protein